MWMRAHLLVEMLLTRVDPWICLRMYTREYVCSDTGRGKGLFKLEAHGDALFCSRVFNFQVIVLNIRKHLRHFPRLASHRE